LTMFIVCNQTSQRNFIKYISIIHLLYISHSNNSEFIENDWPTKILIS
jgi:hypothetical protein